MRQRNEPRSVRSNYHVSEYSSLREVKSFEPLRLKGKRDLGFRDKLSSWTRRLGAGLRTVVVRRTGMLITCLFLIIAGFVQGNSYRAAKEYEAAMTTSVFGQPYAFSLSRTSIVFDQQYRDGSTFIIPFRIGDMADMSTDANNYEVTLQGAYEPIDLDMKARMILFGNTGRGAILIDGEFNPFPINVVLQSNRVLNNEVGTVRDSMTKDEEEMITEMLIEDGRTEDEINAYLDSPRGAYMIGGRMEVSDADAVGITVNPSANNVLLVDGVDFDSSPAQVYNVAMAQKDRDRIHELKEEALNQKRKLMGHLEEYEERLHNDPQLTHEGATLIKEANRIAVSSNGNKTDIDIMNGLLSRAGVDGNMQVRQSIDDRDKSGMTREEQERRLRSGVNPEEFGASNNSSTLRVLSELREQFMSVNQLIVVYDAQLDAVNEAAVIQDRDASETFNYKIKSPAN